MNQMQEFQPVLWITDPWDTLDDPSDTTLRLMQEGFFLGLNQFWCDIKTVCLKNSRVCLAVQQVIAVDLQETLGRKKFFRLGNIQIKQLKDFSQIHYRPDPPVDQTYLHPLQMMALDLRSLPECELINPLEILLTRNEKIEATHLGSMMPPTLVSSQWEALLSFGKEEGLAVLKPLATAQSHGIELLDFRTRSKVEIAQRHLKKATKNFQTPIVLQRYLQDIVEEGEIRLWFLDGFLLAWIKKHPLQHDFRVNIDQGSALSVVKLTLKQKKQSQKIGDYLKFHKIRLAAVDLIENYVTDFNFTSPGLIPQMESILSENLSKIIVKKLHVKN